LKITSIAGGKLDTFLESEHASVTNTQIKKHNMTSSLKFSSWVTPYPLSSLRVTNILTSNSELVIGSDLNEQSVLLNVRKIILMTLNVKVYDYLLATIFTFFQHAQACTHAFHTFWVEHFYIYLSIP
jgi:hypothetical protein